MTEAPVPLAEPPTAEDDEKRLASIWRFVWTHGPETDSAAGCIRFLLRLLDAARAERDAARQSVIVMAERSAKLRAEHKATLQQHERAMAVLREPTYGLANRVEEAMRSAVPTKTGRAVAALKAAHDWLAALDDAASAAATPAGSGTGERG